MSLPVKPPPPLPAHLRLGLEKGALSIAPPPPPDTDPCQVLGPAPPPAVPPQKPGHSRDSLAEPGRAAPAGEGTASEGEGAAAADPGQAAPPLR
eukprot:9947049-Lingulodinium_polyedra.AAC.1